MDRSCCKRLSDFSKILVVFMGMSCIELEFPDAAVNAGGGGNGGSTSTSIAGSGGAAGDGGASSAGGTASGSSTSSSVSGGSSAGETAPSSCDKPVGQHGLYCGGNGVGGHPGTLYKCDDGVLTVDKVCEFGCEIAMDSTVQNDRCKTGAARDIAEKMLSRPAPQRFLLGLGNDRAEEPTLDGAYTLPLDIHDILLYGMAGEGGWPDWGRGGGSFVNLTARIADAYNLVPMFTFGVLSTEAERRGEGELAELLGSSSMMTAYWNNVIDFLERVADYGKPVLVHVEPQLWAYAERQARGGDPQNLRVDVVPGACVSWIKDWFPGFGRCWLHLAHTLAPRAVIAFHAASTTPDSVAFLNQVGGESTDFVVVGPFERDAGCYESGDCTAPVSGPWYWDEHGFEQHLIWANRVSDGLGKPVLWWQLPLGKPSDTPGGTPGHYRDNRVEFLFNFTDRFAGISALGGLGAVFGAGDDQQTSIATDGGQLRDAVTEYAEHPTLLP